jgi:hypothetical protein
MMTPQLTEQYGQVLRVSVVRASLKGRTACATASSNPPNPNDPIAEPATPAPVSLMNRRRDNCMFMGVPPRDLEIPQVIMIRGGVIRGLSKD